MTEQHTCRDCIHCEEIRSLYDTVYCRWINDCNKDTKANECRDYVHKQFFKGEEDD